MHEQDIPGFYWWGRASERPYPLLAAAMILAAGIRLYLFSQYYCISSDGVRYIEAAESFFAGNISAGLSSLYPPLYPLMIAAFYPFVGNWEWAGQIVSMVAGVAVLWPIFLLFRKIYGAQIALVACILAAIAPFLTRYSVHVRSESLFILLSTLALLCFQLGIENRLRSNFFFGGLLIGLAYLARPESLGFLVIVPISLLGAWRFGRSVRFSDVSLCSLLTLLGFIVFAGPYVGYLAIDSGNWAQLSRKTNVTLFYGFKDTGLLNEDELAAILAPGGPGVANLILTHPWSYVKKIASDLPASFLVYFEAVYFSYVPFLLVGIFRSVRQKFWQRIELLLFICVIFYLVGFAAIYVNLRYAIPLIPASLGWVASGLIWSFNYEHFKRFISPKALNMTALLLGTLFVGATLAKTLQPIAAEKAYVKVAGRYLNKMNRDGKLKLAVLDNRIPFYAGASAVYLFGIKETALRAYLEEHKPQYLAIDTKPWRREFPHAAERPGDFGLTLEREFVGTKQDHLAVYKVKL